LAGIILPLPLLVFFFFGFLFFTVHSWNRHKDMARKQELKPPVKHIIKGNNNNNNRKTSKTMERLFHRIEEG